MTSYNSFQFSKVAYVHGLLRQLFHTLKRRKPVPGTTNFVSPNFSLCLLGLSAKAKLLIPAFASSLLGAD
jgi:hypothetical protein